MRLALSAISQRAGVSRGLLIKCHSERSEESRIKFARIIKGSRQRCFASLNMTTLFMKRFLRRPSRQQPACCMLAQEASDPDGIIERVKPVRQREQCPFQRCGTKNVIEPVKSPIGE